MRKLITSILTLLSIAGVHSQNVPTNPKLVVGITIDQLRTDYIEAFAPLFGNDGFKRLWKEGRVYRHAEYGFSNIDCASAIATIYTGTTPSTHGIISKEWMNPSSLQPENCVDDPEYMGNYTVRNTSPKKLLVSTLSDELKISTKHKGLVYSIAPTAEAAIFSAGHIADGAFWLNTDNGKWCSTTYYKDFPWWASRYNDRSSLDFRISDWVWSPFHPSFKYEYAAGWQQEPFKHKFNQGDKYQKVITSPFINDEINLLTTELFSQSGIGEDETTDFLAITYYAGNFEHQNVNEFPMEIQDIYTRLDKNLADLFALIEERVGLNNVLFFVTSTGYTDADSPSINYQHIPGGEFHINRCATLLNMYLMATYGPGEYVETYYNNQIYLNRELLQKKELALGEIQNLASDFIIQFSGVDQVYSSNRILLGGWSPDLEKIKNGFHRKRSGDLTIEVLPGWTLMNKDSYENTLVRNSAVLTPLIFMGNQITPEVIDNPTHITKIAPTIAHSIKIRAPNASKAIPLLDIR